MTRIWLYVNNNNDDERIKKIYKSKQSIFFSLNGHPYIDTTQNSFFDKTRFAEYDR